MLLKFGPLQESRIASTLVAICRGGVAFLVCLGVLAVTTSACNSSSSAVGRASGNSTLSGNTSLATVASPSAEGTPQEVKETYEYIDGHWIPFSSAKPLSMAQWAVVDAYANFSSAALEVYADHSVLPLANVISSQSKVTKMFQKFLTEGKNPEALYTKATVQSVNISGCRARLTLELYYPNEAPLDYISSWVRPFDKALFHLSNGSKTASLLTKSSNPDESTKTQSASKVVEGQYAPWLFVGDNRVGGYKAPCGV